MEPTTTTTTALTGDGVPNAGNANSGIQAGAGEPPAYVAACDGLISGSATAINAPLSQSPARASQINLPFSVAPADLPSFSRLPESVRDGVHRKLLCLQTIHRSVNSGISVMAACKSAATLAHQSRGYSAPRLRVQYYEYLRTQDWRCLIDRARAGADFIDRGSLRQDLHPEFIEFWRSLCERYQRKSRPARRELLHIWRTHHSYPRGIQPAKYYKTLPSYKDWPVADPATGIPAGWSEGNLYRYAPTKFELTAARIGRTAAGDYRPQVFTSRVGLRAGQYYLFDDQEYDLKVNYLGPRGGSRAMRPLGLNALDLFSACLFAYAFKPTIWNQESLAKEKLKEKDMMWFVVHVLTNIGYLDDKPGTTLIVEHGTAAIREDFEQRIFDATHGLVKVERSGIQGRSATDFQFDGASKGNFRFKAALESIFNLVRNEMAALPGQVGKDRLRSPEELVGRDRYNNTLIKAGMALSDQERELLLLPFMNWDQFTNLCLALYARINARVDHDLEGWQRAGLVTNEWRINDQQPWLRQSEFLALPSVEQAVARQLIECNPSLSRARKLAPVEVFETARPRLAKIQIFLLPQLLGMEFGTERKVKNGLFEFEDEEICPGETLRYLSHSSHESRHAALKDGETYITFLNPFSPDQLAICDSAGRYLGACPRWTSSARSDVDSIHRQMGQVRKIEAELLAPVARRGADLAREKLEMHRHNAAILSGSARLTPEDRAVRRQVAAEKTDPTEAFPVEPSHEQPSTRPIQPSAYAVTEDELNQL